MPTRRTVLVALSAGLAGCGATGGPDSVPGTPTPPAPATDAWYTHAQPTGNRALDGAGDLRSAEPVEFSPEGRPEWLVARPGSEGSHWTVATDEGRVTDWQVVDGAASATGEWGAIPPETQPVVVAGESGPTLLAPPGGLAGRSSPLVAPGTDGQPSRLLYVAGDGALVVAGPEPTRLAVDALQDGRLAALEDGRYALFTGPTERYRHGALGDRTEATTMTVVDATAGEVTAEATLADPLVFEGLQPLVADLDGDGAPELVTTVADSADGARIAVFSPDGERLATGPIHEPGWRHQLAVAPFGPDGHPELAVVRKPHVDHVLEFYRLREGELDVVATDRGFSSHTFGSRILDQAVAGEFDADGATDILVPTTARDELAAVHRTDGGATTDWSLPLGGPLVTNVTGTGLAGGGLAVGAATDESVWVWQTGV